jgi:hypothetical protein
MEELNVSETIIAWLLVVGSVPNFWCIYLPIQYARGLVAKTFRMDPLVMVAWNLPRVTADLRVWGL